MSVRQRRDQRMTGDPAPLIEDSEAERRALRILERLRTPQEPRVEWLDRGTEGRRGTEPTQTPPPRRTTQPSPPRRRTSRQTSPPQTRTDPTYVPPRQTLSEGERREIIEWVSPPQSSGGVEWLPPATTGNSSGSLDERLQEQQREIEELQRQYARGTQDRGVQEDTPRRLTRDRLGETRQPLLPPDHPFALPPNHPLRFQRRLREGSLIPDRSDLPFLMLPSRELGNRIADEIPRLEAELRQTPILGNIAGIFLGVWRYFTSIAESLVALPGIIRELFQEIINLDRERLIEIGLLLRDLALASPTDPEVMRPIAEAVWAPVLEIGENFRLGVEAADHDQVESSARIIQATLGIIDLIDTLGGVLQAVRRSPQYLTHLRRLASLRRSRRQLAVLLERTRRRLQRSELGNFALRLLEDERGSLDLDALTMGRRIRGRTIAEVIQFREAVRQRRARGGRAAERRILSEHELYPPHRREPGGGVPEATFREWAIDHISEDPNNLLWFLLDPNEGNFRRAIPSLIEGPEGEFLLPRGADRYDHSRDMQVHMGHTVSAHAGGRRLALEWSYLNLDDSTIERFGGIIERGAVDIGGIPVEARTAVAMEIGGYIPAGTVERARPHPGWSLEEWSVRRSSTPGELIWEQTARPARESPRSSGRRRSTRRR